VAVNAQWLSVPNGCRVKVITEIHVVVSCFQKMLISVFLFCSLVRQKMNSAEITDDDEGKKSYVV